MLFDKLCKVAEREMPSLASKLRTIKLFHFPGKPHEFLPKEVDSEIVTFLREQFMLPFQSIAVEDDAGLVILEDLTKNIRGIDHERKFIDVIRLNSPAEAFREGYDPSEDAMLKVVKDLGMLKYDPLIISYGAIERVNWMDTTNFLAYGRIDRITTVTIIPQRKKHIFSDYNGKQLDYIDHQMVQLHLKSATTNAMTAIQEILYTNTPNKFILEISPVKKETKKKKKNNKIPRSDQRSKYILLTPKEIRTIIKEDHLITPSGRKSPKIHERRAHPRTFHSNRFIHMKDKTIMIPAIWIGTSEKIVGTKRYKVMLDM
jgi:hypothetical protein